MPSRESPLVWALRRRSSWWGGEADPSLPALAVLRALHALARHWHTLYRAACLPDHRPLLPGHDFVNAKVQYHLIAKYYI